MASLWHSNDSSCCACWFEGRQLHFISTWDSLSEIIIWNFWPNLLIVTWRSQEQRPLSMECLRFSPTRACVRGDFAVTVLLMSLSCGISSWTVSSCCYFNLFDLTASEDEVMVAQPWDPRVHLHCASTVGYCGWIQAIQQSWLVLTRFDRHCEEQVGILWLDLVNESAGWAIARTSANLERQPAWHAWWFVWLQI